MTARHSSILHCLAVALVCFLAGMILAPGGTVMTVVRKKLSYTRNTAQRLYDAWKLDELYFAENGSSFRDFVSDNDTFLVYFWATWCPHCANVADTIESLKNASIPLVAMPFDTDRDAYDSYLRDNHPFWLNAMQKTETGELSFCPREDAHNIPLIPSVWFVRGGKVKSVFIGETGVDELISFLKKRAMLP